MSVFDDYAHHPTEIRATLGAARRVAEQGRVVACFQPHLFTRTRDFADEFGAALTLADEVFVTDVYPAREEPLAGVSGRLVHDAVLSHGGSSCYVADKAMLPEVLAGQVRPGDLVITLGAGDISLIGSLLLPLLQDADA